MNTLVDVLLIAAGFSAVFFVFYVAFDGFSE
jgi:hypothetical protein